MRNFVLGSLALRTGEARRLHESLSAARQAGRGFSLGYVNPHVYNLATAHAAVGAFLESCDFVCLDGIGAAFAARAQNLAWFPRLVMDQVFDAAVSAGAVGGRILLLGLTEAEIQAAARALEAASPRLSVAGRYSGFLRDTEYGEILRRHADADFVLAGMGTPRSEGILLSARRILPRAVVWHVGGGTLRNWAGSKRRAPRWISRAGLEWAHRVWHEPETRARYSSGFARFASRVVRDRLAARSFRTETYADARPIGAAEGRSEA